MNIFHIQVDRYNISLKLSEPCINKNCNGLRCLYYHLNKEECIIWNCPGCTCSCKIKNHMCPHKCGNRNSSIACYKNHLIIWNRCRGLQLKYKDIILYSYIKQFSNIPRSIKILCDNYLESRDSFFIDLEQKLSIINKEITEKTTK